MDHLETTSLSDLNPIISYAELTHLGFETLILSYILSTVRYLCSIKNKED